MDYLLDANACIVYLNGRSLALKQRLESHRRENIYVCSIVKAELYYGAMRSQNPQETLRIQKAFFEGFTSLPFDDKAVEYYGKIRADLVAKRQPIGPNDFLIAAIALANHKILVTHNTGEFSRIEGLLIEDWQQNMDS